MVKVMKIRGLMMEIKWMIPHGRIDCYRYVAIGILAVLPLASYSEAQLMRPVDDVQLAELPPIWLDTPLPIKPSISSDSFAVRQSQPIGTAVEKADAASFAITPVAVIDDSNSLQKSAQVVKLKPKASFNMASLLESAKQGNVESQYQLGMRYQYGDEVRMDLNKANQWLAKAARSGDAHSQHALSMFYQQYATNTEGAKKALLWEKKAADHGSADAQYALGVMFKNGRLVRKNKAESRKWLAMAAKQGHIPAQLVLKE